MEFRVYLQVRTRSEIHLQLGYFKRVTIIEFLHT